MHEWGSSGAEVAGHEMAEKHTLEKQCYLPVSARAKCRADGCTWRIGEEDGAM